MWNSAAVAGPPAPGPAQRRPGASLQPAAGTHPADPAPPRTQSDGRAGPAGLEHGDAHTGVLAQACREHAAGGPGTDDDVVVRVGHQPLAPVMTTFMTSTGCSMAKAIASGARSSGYACVTNGAS